MLKITNKHVAICLATYNGEKYIAQQIDSILSQTYSYWTLFVRDDCSTDKTRDILNVYVEKYPDKIFFIPNFAVNPHGAKNNFSCILKWIKSRYQFSYFMFSDQDDIWLKNKIEVSMKKINKLEKKFSKDMPLLIHTDLKVVDQNLSILGKSFFRYRALNPDITDLNHLLVQNNITGCTMLWNKQLNQLFDLENEKIVMHDWWIALVASCFGVISYVNRPMILYRQHQKNVVGATRVNTPYFLFQKLTGNTKIKQTLELSIKQAKEFLCCYEKKISQEQYNILNKYVHIMDYKKIKRIYIIFKQHFLKQGIIQIIGEILYL